MITLEPQNNDSGVMQFQMRSQQCFNMCSRDFKARYSNNCH